MRIAIGADHAGFDMKESVKAALLAGGHDVTDFGPADDSAVDYPDYAEPVAKAVAAGEADFGILSCGTGLGMEIAANKVPGARAVQVTDPEFAKMARAHNDANILTLAGRHTNAADALEIVDAFLSTPWDGAADDGERHRRRIGKIAALEKAGGEPTD